MTVQWVTLVLDCTDATGVLLARGGAVIVPSAQLPVAGQMLIGQEPVTASFGQAPSPPSVRLASTDSVAPFGGWNYTIAFPGVPGNPPSFSFYLSSANGATQYLSALLPVPAAQPLPGTNVDGGSAANGQYPVADLDGGHA